MSKKIGFTKAILDKATCPAGESRVWLSDAKTPTLTLMITRTGSKAFYVYRRVHGRPQRYRLGAYPGELTIEQARKKAANVNSAIADGADPQLDRQRARETMTLAELFDFYLTNHAKPHKKTWKQDVGFFNYYFGKAEAERKPGERAAASPGWRNRRINTISASDYRSLHVKIGEGHGRHVANRVLILLQSMLCFAKLPNIIREVTLFKHPARDRFLQPEELPKFFDAVAQMRSTTGRDFILLSIHTGARRGNLRAMRWDQISFERQTWTIPETKNGEGLTVPLVAPALRILMARKLLAGNSPWVFPSATQTGHMMSVSRSFSGICQAAGIKNLRVHDLRRTLASYQAAAGASMIVIGKGLGHKPGSTATAIYARLNLDPVRASISEATNVIGAHMPAGLLPEPGELPVGSERIEPQPEALTLLRPSKNTESFGLALVRELLQRIPTTNTFTMSMIRRAFVSAYARDIKPTAVIGFLNRLHDHGEIERVKRGGHGRMSVFRRRVDASQPAVPLALPHVIDAA